MFFSKYMFETLDLLDENNSNGRQCSLVLFFIFETNDLLLKNEEHPLLKVFLGRTVVVFTFHLLWNG